MAASRTPLARLGHVRDEIEAIAEVMHGIDLATLEGAYVLRRTTEHAVLIISEAIRALPQAWTDDYPGIDWHAIRKIGSVLRHDYFQVDPPVLWRVINEKLPELRAVVERMIADHSE